MHRHRGTCPALLRRPTAQPSLCYPWLSSQRLANTASDARDRQGWSGCSTCSHYRAAPTSRHANIIPAHLLHINPHPKNGNECVLDARSRGRYVFRGRQPHARRSIPPLAIIAHAFSNSLSFLGTEPEPRPELSSGHIPGSFNLPFDTFVDSQEKVRIASLRGAQKDHIWFHP